MSPVTTVSGGSWSERLKVISCLQFTVLAAMSRLSLSESRARVVECVEPVTARVIR